MVRQKAAAARHEANGEIVHGNLNASRARTYPRRFLLRDAAETLSRGVVRLTIGRSGRCS